MGRASSRPEHGNVSELGAHSDTEGIEKHTDNLQWTVHLYRRRSIAYLKGQNLGCQFQFVR